MDPIGGVAPGSSGTMEVGARGWSTLRQRDELSGIGWAHSTGCDGDRAEARGCGFRERKRNQEKNNSNNQDKRDQKENKKKQKKNNGRDINK